MTISINRLSAFPLSSGNGQTGDDIADLASYLARQLNHVYPLQQADHDERLLQALLPIALQRFQPIAASVRSFVPEQLDVFNTLQYASLIYLLSNESARMGDQAMLANRLFGLNKALHAIDLFHAVQLPGVFFLSHASGAVLGNVTYGDRLVVFQNVTVGRVGEDRPEIGNNVVLYPNVVISGRTRIGDGSTVSAGVVLHNVRVPANVLVKPGVDGPVFREYERAFANRYLR